MENSIIQYGRHNITQEDIEAVKEVLFGNYLTQGSKVYEFEVAFATYVGAKFAISVSNGTAALHLSTIALALETGQKVITSPITFVASANCVRYCGGDVVFGDIDPETYLLDINSVRDLLEASPMGTYKGIIPVDFAGRAVDLEAYRKLADDFGLWIIEDACHAPGGFFINSNGLECKCGSGEYADLAIFSFHPVKHIATGEGGMITTNNEALYLRLLSLRTHGIVKNNALYRNSMDFAAGVENAKSYPLWYMEMQELGYNYRLTDFQAALGLSQLQRADKGIIRRKEIATVYEKSFKNKDYIKGESGIINGHAYHLYIIEVDDRLGLYNFLRENQVYAQIHYIPCHLMPYYRSLGYNDGDRPRAEKYYKKCISLPMYPTLSEEQQLHVIKLIDSYYAG